MTGIVSETSVEEIARYLEDKKSQKQHVGLFLGHRTGGLFNDALYKVVKRRTMFANDLPKLLKRGISTAKDLSEMLHHIQSLDNLSAIDKFSECYSFLGKYFSEKGIHDILHSTLIPTRYSEEDELMARLIKAGFFDTIITTSIDASLDEACVLLEMKESDDYRVIICGSDDSMALEQRTRWRRQSWRSQIVKVFGDFDSLKYSTVGNEFDLEIDQMLKRFLVSELAKDIIMLGYDPLWDWPIERAFQEAGRMLWYVNEEQPLKNSHLAYVLNQRGVKYLVGPQGSYRSFLQALYDLTGERASRKTEIGQPLPLAPSQDPNRNKVFISYSHKNKEYLERLQDHLKGLLHVEKDALSITYGEVWDDTAIVPGAAWIGEIRNALAHAKVAVLLVSADFFASKFISEEELPALLEAARSNLVEIISVRLGPCVFKYTELSHYHSINDDTELLMGKELHEQDKVWIKLIEQVFLRSDPPK